MSSGAACPNLLRSAMLVTTSGVNISGISQVPHWGRDKMAAISQTTLSNAFSWMKMILLLPISLKFVPKGPINIIPALIEIMPLSEPMLVSLLTHICITRPEWVNTGNLFIYKCLDIVIINSLGIARSFACNLDLKITNTLQWMIWHNPTSQFLRIHSSAVRSLIVRFRKVLKAQLRCLNFVSIRSEILADV